MYKMEINSDEKTLSIIMSGMMTEKDSIEYLEELKNKIRTINPYQYYMIMDAYDYKTAPSQLIGYAKEAMELIAKIPFKKRYGIMPKSLIAVSQFERITKAENKFDDTIFMDSYQDVIKLIHN